MHFLIRASSQRHMYFLVWSPHPPLKYQYLVCPDYYTWFSSPFYPILMVKDVVFFSFFPFHKYFYRPVGVGQFTHVITFSGTALIFNDYHWVHFIDPYYNQPLGIFWWIQVSVHHYCHIIWESCHQVMQSLWPPMMECNFFSVLVLGSEKIPEFLVMHLWEN